MYAERNKSLKIYTIFILTMMLSVVMTGCHVKNQNGFTVDEPDITLEYLEGEYVEQLIRDGAEHLFGNIEIIKGDDGSTEINIITKELVTDSINGGKTLIEDRNYEISYPLSEEARCTFLQGGVSVPQILSAYKFVEQYESSLKQDLPVQGDNSEYLMYYDLYIMNDQIELILAKYIP